MKALENRPVGVSAIPKKALWRQYQPVSKRRERQASGERKWRRESQKREEMASMCAESGFWLLRHLRSNIEEKHEEASKRQHATKLSWRLPGRNQL